MARKKKKVNETATKVVFDYETAVPAVEGDQVFASLRTHLAKISKRKGVIGYILRNATSAIIDLKNTAKLVKYAILFHQALDSGKEILDLFDVGEVENILIEGKNNKVLCMVMGENRVGIFMKRDADHASILSRVSP